MSSLRHPEFISGSKIVILTKNLDQKRITNNMTEYQEFQERLKMLISKNPQWIVNTLSNIFTMRLLGNKTHGDLAEVGIAEFINQFMYDYKSIHVGKDLFRAKSNEEDIVIINEITKSKLPLSLKAYGHGPLQLSTDKECRLYPYLESFNFLLTEDSTIIHNILLDPIFQNLTYLNVMPLIYDEKAQKCNIMIFDYNKAKVSVAKIEKRVEGKGRTHPVYVFLDDQNRYMFEVRYGGKSANALQRGLWTNTKNAGDYFNSLTNGWITYAHNIDLVKLIALALNSRSESHVQANNILQSDIDSFKYVS